MGIGRVGLALRRVPVLWTQMELVACRIKVFDPLFVNSYHVSLGLASFRLWLPAELCPHFCRTVSARYVSPQQGHPHSAADVASPGLARALVGHSSREECKRNFC